MKILINNDIDREKWEQILNSSPFSSPFQTPAFYEFFNSIDNFSADVFAVEEGSEITSLVVVTIQKEKGIKGYFSRRGIVYGVPLVKNSSKESLNFLLKYLKIFYNGKIIYLEIRNNFDFSQFKDVFIKENWEYSPHLNVHLVVFGKNLEEILKSMNYNKRHQISISLKEGATVSVCNSVDEIIQIYNILKELYDTRVKRPLPSMKFFISFLNSEITRVFVVKHNNIVIGGSFCITDNTNSINTIYYAGLRNYHNKIFPTHLAILGALEYAIKNKIKVLDFMGAGKPNVPYGVRDYKLEFGGELAEHGRFLKILNPLLYNIGKMGLKVLGTLRK
ncbi:MAG: peptidoglycan bridge formation glycyltransferase FemA/FemB family protein [Flavobacterium piscis]|nr:peptidoglycan bridge formation glycyltransferase FemA/FemB family protein [Flavobacterium piscis]